MINFWNGYRKLLILLVYLLYLIVHLKNFWYSTRRSTISYSFWPWEDFLSKLTLRQGDKESLCPTVVAGRDYLMQGLQVECTLCEEDFYSFLTAFGSDYQSIWEIKYFIYKHISRWRACELLGYSSF